MRATMAVALSLLREREGWRLTIHVRHSLVHVAITTPGGNSWQASHRLPYQALLNTLRKVPK